MAAKPIGSILEETVEDEKVNEEGKANDIEMTNEEKKESVLDKDIIAQHFKGRSRQIISFLG